MNYVDLKFDHKCQTDIIIEMPVVVEAKSLSYQNQNQMLKTI